MRRAEAHLEQARLGRHDRVGRDGHAHDEIDVLGCSAGALERLQRGAGGEIGGRLPDGDATLVNARARHDPLVARVDDARHLVIRYHKIGQSLAVAGNLASH